MLKIIFVCTHNRCRSILFEAITNHFGQGKVVAKSAGSAPESAVHPKAIKHLQKAGIDTSELFSKGLPELEDFNADVIITVCDNAQGEPCPVIFSQTPKVHWGLSDPSSLPEPEQDEAFEKTLHLLQSRITQLVTALETNTFSLTETLNEIGKIHEH